MPDPRNPNSWISHFDERQQKEIAFACLYERDFNHGTDGHSSKIIIAEMTDILDAFEENVRERLKGKTPEAWAQNAYNRYFISANGKNFSGGDMPSWDELPEAIRGHWVAAIQGVI